MRTIGPKVPYWMREEFDKWNAQLFGGQVPLPDFKVGNMKGHPGYSIWMAGGAIIWFHPQTLAHGRAFASDTLLHEMVHGELFRATGDGCQEHGAAFVELANHIGRELGLPDVTLGTDDVLNWPQSVRPKGFHPFELK